MREAQQAFPINTLGRVAFARDHTDCAEAVFRLRDPNYVIGKLRPGPGGQPIEPWKRVPATAASFPIESLLSTRARCARDRLSAEERKDWRAIESTLSGAAALYTRSGSGALLVINREKGVAYYYRSKSDPR